MRNDNERGLSLLEISISMLLSTIFVASIHIEILSIIKLWVNTSTLIDIQDTIHRVEDKLIICSRDSTAFCSRSEITRILKENNTSTKLNICITEEKGIYQKPIGYHIFASYSLEKNEELNEQLINNIAGGLSGVFIRGHMQGYKSTLNTWFIPQDKICNSIIYNNNHVFLYNYITLQG